MAKQGQGVVTVEHDGISVDVDMDFIGSWEGMVTLADMQSERLPESQRFIATIEYYRRVCANVGDVSDQLTEREGRPVKADALMEFVGAAVREATPKN